MADLTNAAGVTDQSGATITLYAVWDDCPWIVAENLYYTLTQAQSGYITDSEILSHATAYDREDGSPIEPGFHENGTSFRFRTIRHRILRSFDAKAAVRKT